MRKALAASLLVLLGGSVFLAGCRGDEKAKESEAETRPDEQAQVAATPSRGSAPPALRR